MSDSYATQSRFSPRIIAEAVEPPGTCALSGRGNETAGYIDLRMKAPGGSRYVSVVVIRSLASDVLGMVLPEVHERALREQAQRFEQEQADLIDYKAASEATIEMLSTDLIEARAAAAKVAQLERALEATKKVVAEQAKLRAALEIAEQERDQARAERDRTVKAPSAAPVVKRGGRPRKDAA